MFIYTLKKKRPSFKPLHERSNTVTHRILLQKDHIILFTVHLLFQFYPVED